ncbi:unnamed protein product [Angiostrongylus costaricensis]|uniref:ZnMc domain-containing protein n=1 Tax=Angiostrongylus costaricensis TaxID=334426 RepID=A0A0R3PD53_ANGCS|nr:unnamed protein product [Angiostrongylus costaricensis]
MLNQPLDNNVIIKLVVDEQQLQCTGFDLVFKVVFRTTLHRALHEWSSVSAVRFDEVPGRADIVIGFERGHHEDAFPFDGKGYYSDGRLHFDADEDWSLNSSQGVNLFQTAVHEIGHLLGLEHSVDPRAVMFAARRPYNPDFTLGECLKC